MGWSRYLRRRHWDEERKREIEAHVALEIDEQVARGVPPRAAREAAVRKFGNRTRVRETIYDMNTIHLLETALKDLRYGARLLLAHPGFAVVAILSLTLGIGANTAMFQLLDAVRLRSLPVAQPQELAEVRIPQGTNRSGAFNGRFPNLTYAQWEEIRSQQRAFSGLFAWSATRMNLTRGGEARYGEGLMVSGDFFRVLGVSPSLGRVFTADDDRRGCSGSGAVISHAFWQREFGGAPAVLGRTVHLDGHPFEVIGVTPAAFFGVEVGRRFDVALPLCADAIIRPASRRLERREAWWLAVAGRLRPGWSIEQARAQVQSIAPNVFRATLPPVYQPEDAKRYLAMPLTVLPAGSGVSGLRRAYGNPLLLLLGITGVVLVIACFNLANLLLARATAREREIAVRLAIGASRGRLVRQLLSESLLMAAIGASLGVLLAQQLSGLLVRTIATDQSPVILDLGLNWHVLGFTSALAVLTCVVFGLVPALRATKTAPAVAAGLGGRGMTATRERAGLRRALVVAQVSLSLVLVLGSLLFARTFYNLLTLDTGFQQDGIVVASLDMRRMHVSAERLPALHRELLERLSAVPGVQSVAETSIVPLSGSGWNENIQVDGVAGKLLSNFSRVSPEYFRTTSTPLLAGRSFSDRDTAGTPLVAIVNESFSRKFLRGTTPVGRTFRIETRVGDTEQVYEIVGLVRDTKYRTLRETFDPIVFLPVAQDREPGPFADFVLRSSLAPDALVPMIGRAVASVDPQIAIETTLLQHQLRDSLRLERVMAVLSTGFGLLAVLLATIGLYGVLSYMVSRRQNEIGIRLALGAERRDVIGLVLGEAGRLVLAGLVLGTVLAILTARAAKTLMFGLDPTDATTLTIAVALLAAIALAAGYVPARRAARLEPLEALRHE